MADLRDAGYEVDRLARAEQFARLHVRATGGVQLYVDLGVDWRQDEPVTLDVGPVLSLDDAVGNKVSALFSRGKARDYLDVDAIRATGRFSDEKLMTAVAERDPGFEVGMFGRQLDAVRRIQPAQVARYGVDATQWRAVQERFAQWAAQLRGGRATPLAVASRQVTEPLRVAFPAPRPRRLGSPWRQGSRPGRRRTQWTSIEGCGVDGPPTAVTGQPGG